MNPLLRKLNEFTFIDSVNLSAHFPAEFMLAFPPAVIGSEALPLARANGVLPLIDLHGGSVEEGQRLLTAAREAVFLRLFRPSEALLAFVLQNPEKVAGIYLEAPVFPLAFSLGLGSSRIPYGAIVTCRDDFSHIPPNAALPIIARGNEAGGFGGPLSAFVLLQLALQEVVPAFFLEGGLDVQGAKAAVASGCRGAVIAAAAWGFPEVGAPFAEFSRRLNAGNVTRCFQDDGTSFMLAGKPKPDSATLKHALQHEFAGSFQARLPADSVAAGPDIAFAQPNFQRFQTLAAFITHLKATLDAPVSPLPRNPLSSSRLGSSLGGRLPIVQGPMAKITEKAAFLDAIRGAGALPVAAFSNISPEAGASILRQCEQLGFCPGIGIIGLAMQDELVTEQLAACRGFKVPFILVAAPRPDLVEKLLADGQRLLVHVPHPALLDEYLELGVRAFIFEGGESGGHIGPLSSMVLWQSALARLSRLEPQATPQAIFAGGIASPVATRFLGARWGQPLD